MPNNYTDIKSQTETNVQTKENLEKQIRNDTEALKAKEEEIRDANALSLDTTQLENERDGILSDIDNNKLSLQTTDQNLLLLQDDYEDYIDHTSVVNNLTDDAPILLFPVRLETRFHKYIEGGLEKHQLWIRIFPDDIAIESHEAALTSSEIEAAETYWEAVWIEPDNRKKINAWDVLCRQYTSQRAAWIVEQMKPTNFSVTPRPATPTFPNAATLEKRYTTWTKAPETRVMPDVFVAYLYQTYDPNNPVPTKTKQGRPIPWSLKTGIDPNDENSLKRTGTNNADITASEDIKWMIDFESAVQKGMGIKVDLSLSEYNSQFQRITVLGVKALCDEQQGKGIIQELLENHHYNRGLSLLKQGVRTKNAPDDPSGYKFYEFGNEETYETEQGLKKVSTSLSTNEHNKRDGQRLAEGLGVSYETFDHIYNADGYDITMAMHMNNVLFSSTVAYTMDVIMYPEFVPVSVAYDPVEETRKFLFDYVRARGALSSIRIGKQPYGILPISAFSRLTMPATNPRKDFYEDTWDVASTMSQAWTNAVPNVKVAGNPNQEEAFADAMGKKAVSQDFYSRYGAGPAYIWNNLVFNDMQPEASQWFLDMQQFAADASAETGFNFSQIPFILQMNFKEEQNRVVAGIVDSQPLSETQKTENLPGAEVNYINWLSSSTFYQIRNEDFTNVGCSPDTQPPDSLLYMFMRQSLLLEYFRRACNLLGLSAEQRREYEIINIEHQPVEGMEIPPEALYTAGSSRWAVFEIEYGDPGQTVGMFIDGPNGPGTAGLENIFSLKQSLTELADLPTSDLGLLFGEHIDLVSARLDSWKLGLMNERLNWLRIGSNGTRNTSGTFIGAYGWVENLSVNERDPVNTSGLDLPSSFETPIEDNPGNKGYIHAPSQNQAIAAAVLRAGYDSTADSSNNSTHEVNLTSERVRTALNMFEGVKNGQLLGTLLGYEFERALHDRYDLDVYILPFRTKYKLQVQTAGYEGSADTVSALNVLNGKQLIDDYKMDPDSIFDDLVFQSHTPSASEKTTIKAELKRLSGILDAVGDMAVAEGVFQMVNNNYESADALSAALSGGTNIPDPHVINTPRTGISLNNRVIKLITPQAYPVAPGTPAGSNTWSNLDLSHRALAEPSLNEWLRNMLPSPVSVEIYTSFDNTSPAPPTITRVYLNELNIQPIDLIYIVPETLNNDESELAQRVKKRVRQIHNLSIDKEISIDYSAPPASGMKTLYQLHSYIMHLRKFILDGRYVKSADFASAGSAESLEYDRYDYTDLWTRIDRAINGVLSSTPPTYQLMGLKKIRDDIQARITAISVPTPPVPDLEALADLMQAAAHFGIERSIPKIRGTYYADLPLAAQSVKEQADKKIEVLDAIFLPALQPATGMAAEVIVANVEKLIRCSKILFGDSFRITPKIKVQDTSRDQLNGRFKIGGTLPNTLLSDHTGEPLLMDSWLNSISRVRKKIANFEMMSVLSDVVMENLSMNSIEFRPFQFPYDNDGYDRWLALSINASSEDERIKKLKSNRLCLAISEDTSTDFGQFICGLVIDDWTEVIPNREEVSGIAFHYDQPESKPPQALLLAMSPVFTGSWSWDDLLATVNETLDEAKSRSVIYEDIADTPYGQFLPATCMPVSEGAMTIGPSFYYLSRLFM